MKTSIIGLDARYTLTLEHCGHPTAQWVVRFCDKWLGCYGDKQVAIHAAMVYAEERDTVKPCAIEDSDKQLEAA